MIRDISTLFEQQEEDYYKPNRVSFWNNNYVEFESNSDKNNNLSLDEYLNKIKPLKDTEGYNNWSSKVWYRGNSVNKCK